MPMKYLPEKRGNTASIFKTIFGFDRGLVVLSGRVVSVSDRELAVSWLAVFVL